MIHFAAYLNLFADIATYQNDYRRSFFSSENISPKYIYSLGAGLDMVSYYDIVFRMEASKNFLFNQWGFLYIKVINLSRYENRIFAIYGNPQAQFPSKLWKDIKSTTE